MSVLSFLFFEESADLLQSLLGVNDSGRVVRRVDYYSDGILIYCCFECLEVDLEIRNVGSYYFDLAAACCEEYIVFRKVWSNADKIVFRLACKSAGYRYECRCTSACHENLTCLCVSVESLSEIGCDSFSCALKSRSH